MSSTKNWAAANSTFKRPLTPTSSTSPFSLTKHKPKPLERSPRPHAGSRAASGAGVRAKRPRSIAPAADIDSRPEPMNMFDYFNEYYVPMTGTVPTGSYLTSAVTVNQHSADQATDSISESDSAACVMKDKEKLKRSAPTEKPEENVTVEADPVHNVNGAENAKVAARHKPIPEKRPRLKMRKCAVDTLVKQYLKKEYDFLNVCPVCESENGECYHKVHYIPDSSAGQGSDNYDKRSLPLDGWVVIARSRLHANGVFAAKHIAQYTMFGPFQGINVPEEDYNNEQYSYAYVWEIGTNPKVPGFRAVDGADPKWGNWMRYVNHSVAQKNLQVVVRDNDIYYLTIKDVDPCTELLIDCGKKLVESGDYQDVRLFGGPAHTMKKQTRQEREQWMQWDREDLIVY